MTAALGIPINADLVALARAKLATQLLRTAELDRLTGLLHQGERVVTLCDALCKSGRQEWRGLTVLTDERLISASQSVTTRSPWWSRPVRRSSSAVLNGCVASLAFASATRSALTGIPTAAVIAGCPRPGRDEGTRRPAAMRA